MKYHRAFAVCLIALCGCRYYDVVTPIPPLKENVTAGHKYSAEAIKFLDSPNATRMEVISTLGHPLVESRESRVLLYTWETTRTFMPFQIVSVDRDPSTGAETTTPLNSETSGVARRWGLFIAYNDDGIVYAHEIRRIGASGLEEACVGWRRSLVK